MPKIIDSHAHVVLRRELYESHPWLALNLYHCFVAAKDGALRQAEETLGAWLDTGQVESSLRTSMKADPKAYGMKAARPVLEMVARFVNEQGLSARRVGLDEVFAALTLEV